MGEDSRDKITVSAKVDPDTFDRLEQYRDEREIKRSPAIQRLLRDALDSADSNQTGGEKDSSLGPISLALASFAAVFGISAIVTLSGGEVTLSLNVIRPELSLIASFIAAGFAAYAHYALGR